MKSRVVAIDGPAGTGKSTTAREVARRLGWTYVDSGAFYRVAALLSIRAGLDPADENDRAELRHLLDDTQVDLEVTVDGVTVRLAGEDVSRAIREPAVARVVSGVADDPELREIVNTAIRDRVGFGPAVVDGRDIGTVVFPDALVKVYLEASLEERAKRRAAESESPASLADPTVIAAYADLLAARDLADQSRETGALAISPDAERLDTSALSIPEQVDWVLALIESKEAGNS